MLRTQLYEKIEIDCDQQSIPMNPDAPILVYFEWLFFRNILCHKCRPFDSPQ